MGAEQTTTELHVVFGTGPLGSWTARALLALGKRVRVVNRSGTAPHLPTSVELRPGDAYDHRFTREVTQGAAAVYQCAQPGYTAWVERFPPLQQSILEAAAANGARLIVGDNLYMYGDPGDRPLSEDRPYQPQTRKGRVRAQMAEAVLAAHRAGTVQAALGRASDFFGPEDPNYSRLWFQPALQGKRIQMLGRLDMPHSFSYVPDFGRALAILGTHEEALGQAWHIPSPPPVTQGELLTLLGAAVGRPVKAMLASALLLRTLGLFNPLLGELVEMLYEWQQPFVLDSSRFERTFGMTATPLPQMIAETVAWVRQQNTALALAHT
jgi:nucleoside-diphosphate-sugar epimerase